ncbi:MAG: class I SAM-dependent methyltransferase [Fimbriimonadaceae bacterium]|nr:class I SAM-dependent methyltransferase [Fimbriimonadaceae bacterium]
MKPTQSKSSLIPSNLYAYLIDHWLREDSILERLRDETASMPNAGMQISPEQGQFMTMLVRLMGVRRYLEVGVFTGYSSLGVTLAMGPEGRTVACDVSEEFTAVARRYWADAGIAGQIELHLAPGMDTLSSLITSGSEPFDFMFIDADKANYHHYYEAGLRLVRPGGLIAIDNVFWGGKIADEAVQDEDTLAIRSLNAKLATDERIDLAIVPIGDGLTLARRR